MTPNQTFPNDSDARGKLLLALIQRLDEKSVGRLTV